MREQVADLISSPITRCGNNPIHNDNHQPVELARIYLEMCEHYDTKLEVLDTDDDRQITFRVRGYVVKLRSDVRDEGSNAPVFEVDVKYFHNDKFDVYFKGTAESMRHILKSLD